jgi:hypothetical protein
LIAVVLVWGSYEACPAEAKVRGAELTLAESRVLDNVGSLALLYKAVTEPFFYFRLDSLILSIN